MKGIKTLTSAVVLGLAVLCGSANASIGSPAFLPGVDVPSMPSSMVLDTSEPSNVSIAAQSMQCFTLYTMMMEDSPSDPYRNSVLDSQAMMMGTIYTMNAGTLLVPVSSEQFDQANEIAYASLLNTAVMNLDDVVQQLIDCEGWREAILQHMVLAMDDDDLTQGFSADLARAALSSVPSPRKNYPLKGATRQQVESVIIESFSRLIKERQTSTNAQ